MNKHTPTPWRVVPTTARGADKKTVRVDIVSEGTPFSPSFVAGDILPEDAALMIAAPDLLAALEAMLFATAKADGQIAKEARKIAVSAIAAAKGGKL